MTDDLPTFDFPENTIAGISLRIKSEAAAADLINSALFVLSEVMAHLPF